MGQGHEQRSFRSEVTPGPLQRPASEELAGRCAFGGVWQCAGSIWHCAPPHACRMTSNSISNRYRTTADGRWRSIAADLTFWSVVGASVAALSGPLGRLWSVSQPALAVGGVAFAVLGPGLLVGLSRTRPTPRGLVWSFGLSNLALAPLLWVAAELRWLPLSTAGNWALVSAGVVALVLGVWQLSTLRLVEPTR